jgi:hypothetical protein
LLKVARSVIVSLPLKRLGMTSAVELNPESSLVTEEVENVGTDRMLPAELHTGETAPSKASPEQHLAIGLIVAEFSSTHDRAPHPNPLPPGEGASMGRREGLLFDLHHKKLVAKGARIQRRTTSLRIPPAQPALNEMRKDAPR